MHSDIKENKGKCVLSYNENDQTKGFDTNTELKFKYYQNHGFHKLKQNFTNSNTLSIFHTNISSINANHENPETLLINHLDPKFDIIALSETWVPEN